ncbi:cation efflux family-domain-containing protein [Elsinoe ampelina]|uniref:Cation efflux family-domain-containing protein n=1 Tax=Elsinoe ampelina TaxID=302913 RepID=A0A6A6GH40_9PEZI|nr:cation efflux family-domain-containing protein [Elsinoe ampelina]
MGADLEIKPAHVRTHMGHSHGHGHHHHHDTTYLTSTNKDDPGVKITRVGLYVNVGMAIGKGIGGYAFNSQALTADAIHSLTDLISDFMTLATISYSLRSPTSRFPQGYGKIESLGALAVSGILLSGGIMIGLSAVMALTQQFFPDIAHFLANLGLLAHIHDHGHGAEDLGPNINAAWLAGGSILIKEWLYRATMKVAEEKKSSVLASNAYHHRVDSLTAFVALLTISASHFITNAQWLDPIGGLVISGMIVQAGIQNTKAALLELADVGIEDEIRVSVQEAAESALSGTDAKISEIQGVKSGQNFLLEVAVAVPETSTLRDQRVLEDRIREAVAKKVKGAKRVSVHFIATKDADKGFSQEFLSFNPDETLDHDHGHEHEHEHDHKKRDLANGTQERKR